MYKTAVILCALLTLVSCNSNNSENKGPSSTFVYCSEGSPTAFNPQITTDGTSSNASAVTIYDQLVQMEYGTTNIVPALAKSWEISEDGLSYTFKLREDVEFHSNEFFKPTRKFNADDVIFSFNRQMFKQHPYHDVGGGNYEYFKAMSMHKTIKEVKKIDDHTIQFILDRPEAPFLANLTMGFTSILSKEYSETLAKLDKKRDIDHLPIGTGAFIFKKYIKDTLIRFEANPKYYRGEPPIKKVVFSITPDPSVRFQKLKTGECHLVTEPAPADIANMKTNPSLKVLTREGLNVGYIAFNTEKAPFDNKLVRKAISHALNRESYIKAIYLGSAVVAKSAMPPTIWGYHNEIQEYGHNPELAKKLLKEAGHPNGFETELWTLPVSRPYNPNGKKMGEMIQADLAKIGIKVKLVTYDWPTYIDKSSKGEHQIIQLGWTGDNGDPDNFLHTLLGCDAVPAGTNVARWCNKKFNDIVVEAKQTSTVSARESLYKKAQEIFKDEAPWVPIAHSIVYRAMNKNVEGYIIHPTGHDIFKNVKFTK